MSSPLRAQRAPLRVVHPDGGCRRRRSSRGLKVGPRACSVRKETLMNTQALELSVIVPTYDERDNVGELVARLDRCLSGRGWEVIFVDDDSTDGTAEVVRRLGQRDPRVRCLQRIGRRGLSSACVEGLLASAAPF